VVIVVVAVAGAVMTIGVMIPRRARAEIVHGSTIVSEVCNCRFVLVANHINGNQTTFASHDIQISEGSNVRRAFMGYVSEINGPNTPFAPLHGRLDIEFNGERVARRDSINSEITWAGQNHRALREYVEITNLFQQNDRRSGNWRIANEMITRTFQIQYMIIIERNPDFPLAQIALSDFFYALGVASQIPNSMTETISLPQIPTGWRYSGRNSVIRFVGGTFDDGDESIGSYVMGSTSGSWGSPFFTGVFASEGGWATRPLAGLDPAAWQFTLNATTTATRAGGTMVEPHNGADDSVANLIFYAELERYEPSAPVVETDTCYDDE
jgi:hypothetical protein